MFADIMARPDICYLTAGNATRRCRETGDGFVLDDAVVAVDGGCVAVTACETKPEKIELVWRQSEIGDPLVLGDAWERGYGDMCWRMLDPEEIMPWYFMAYEGGRTHCFGVRTRPNAFCYWRMGEGFISLTLDVRAGSVGVELKGRRLEAASLVQTVSNDRPFLAARGFCRMMCGHDLTPAKPVYGGNDWYCSYGNNSYDSIMLQANRISECSRNPDNRPYMVVDDGWELLTCSGPWANCRGSFGDMARLAEDMERCGVTPGIWIRPLYTQERTPQLAKINADTAGNEGMSAREQTLDPTDDAVLEQVGRDIRRLHDWGYKLIKHDYSTYDIMGLWGRDMGSGLIAPGRRFRDSSRTTAEIIKRLYLTIRESAGEGVTVIGCNTIGHLAAGIFELQRTGDDTSGREWTRTKNMGVNTLAFRLPQNGTFFAADADCIGITRSIPWEKNRLWLDAVMRSGSPLFASIAEDAYDKTVKEALTHAFDIASVQDDSLFEPVNWMTRRLPTIWQKNGERYTYDWDMI